MIIVDFVMMICAWPLGLAVNIMPACDRALPMVRADTIKDLGDAAVSKQDSAVAEPETPVASRKTTKSRSQTRDAAVQRHPLERRRSLYDYVVGMMQAVRFSANRVKIARRSISKADLPDDDLEHAELKAIRFTLGRTRESPAAKAR
jgi:hypothetical protein